MYYVYRRNCNRCKKKNIYIYNTYNIFKTCLINRVWYFYLPAYFAYTETESRCSNSRSHTFYYKTLKSVEENTENNLEIIL